MDANDFEKMGLDIIDITHFDMDMKVVMEYAKMYEDGHKRGLFGAIEVDLSNFNTLCKYVQIIILNYFWRKTYFTHK